VSCHLKFAWSKASPSQKITSATLDQEASPFSVDKGLVSTYIPTPARGNFNCWRWGMSASLRRVPFWFATLAEPVLQELETPSMASFPHIPELS
jgi:hypothetical protein